MLEQGIPCLKFSGLCTWGYRLSGMNGERDKKRGKDAWVWIKLHEFVAGRQCYSQLGSEGVKQLATLPSCHQLSDE